VISPAKIIRAVAGIIVVAALGLVVLNWWSDFKTAAVPAATTQSQTAGVGSLDSTTTSGTVGLVKTSGLNFRTKPSSAATLIRGLKKGDKLQILSKDGTWYQVKDAKGRVGWVTASSDYIVLQTKSK
jgi:uncharacterized protein YgiM (DUF1202 family)